MAETVKSLLESAHASVPRVDHAEARRMLAEDQALLVDVRDAPERAEHGRLKGACHVSRGMLEFRADETTPYYNPEFRKDRPIILHCASGGRSALAGQRLQQMGYQKVYNLGGFKDACEAGMERDDATGGVT